ncbi:MAG: hypothetical protein ABIT83_14925 [Massilia sp.]
MRVLISQASTPLKLSAAVLLLLPALACQAAEPAAASAPMAMQQPADEAKTTLTAEPATAEANAALMMEQPAAEAKAVLSAEPSTASSTPAQPPTVIVEAKPMGKVSNIAVAAAVADGLSTAAALGSGAIETNPLIPTSPLGLIAMTSAKILLVKYADTLPEQEKRTVVKTASAAWGGAAINNLMVLLAAPPPMPILAGIAMGFMTWKYTSHKYEQQDLLAAAARTAPAAGPSAAPMSPAAPAAPAATDAVPVTGFAQAASE